MYYETKLQSGMNYVIVYINWTVKFISPRHIYYSKTVRAEKKTRVLRNVPCVPGEIFSLFSRNYTSRRIDTSLFKESKVTDI